MMGFVAADKSLPRPTPVPILDGEYPEALIPTLPMCDDAPIEALPLL